MTGKQVTHYHVWTRSGRIFRMHARTYSDASNARRAAVRLNPHPADRLVLACESCPPSVRSRRPRGDKLKRLGHQDRVKLSHRLADALELPVGRVRGALDAALDAGRVQPQPEPDATPAR